MSVSMQFLSKMDENSTSENLISDLNKKLVLSERVEKSEEDENVNEEKSRERPDDEEEEKEDLSPPTTLSKWFTEARIKLKDVKGCGWKERSTCLKILQDLCKSDRVTEEELAAEENWNILLPLMRTQLLDLRSAVMREACNTVQVMSEHARTNLGSFVSSLLPTFVDRSACGNKVISRYARIALLAIVETSHPENVIDLCLQYMISSKNKKVREISMSVASVVLRCYSLSEKNIDVVENLLTKGQADAAIEVREATRECFEVFRKQYSDEAERFLFGLSKKVKERLEKKTPSVRRKVRARSGRVRKCSSGSRKRLISNGDIDNAQSSKMMNTTITTATSTSASSSER